MAPATSERDRTFSGRGKGHVPEGPQQLSTRSWLGVLRRTVREFQEDSLTDWAAALTYYGIFALFPALLALISILGLIGPSATQPLLHNLSSVAPGPAKTISANGRSSGRSNCMSRVAVG